MQAKDQHRKWQSFFVNVCLCREDLKEPELKRVMLRKEIAKIIKALGLISDVLQSQEYYTHFEILRKVFEWKLKHFKDRMNPNIQYIDTMHLEDPRSLQINKLITDFDNIKMLLFEIYDDCPAAIETLKDCIQLLDIREALEQQFQTNEDILAELRENYMKRHQILAMGMQQRVEKRNRVVEMNVVQTVVLDPIYWRCVRNIHDADDEFFGMQLKQQGDRVIDQSESYIRKGELDKMASGNTYQFLRAQIWRFRAKIAEWSFRYEVDFENADNQVSSLKESIRILIKNTADMKERCAWFRSERARIAKEEADNQEKLRLEQLELEKLEAEMKVSNKKKERKKKPPSPKKR